jgi:hypothetical protein
MYWGWWDEVLLEKDVGPVQNATYLEKDLGYYIQ